MNNQEQSNSALTPTTTQGYGVAMQNDIPADELAEAMAGVKLQFTYVSIDKDEGKFKVAGNDDTDAMFNEIEGVILFKAQKRVMFQEGSVNVLCRSNDAKKGGKGWCETCPHAQKGGKCKQKLEMYIMRKGEQMPIILSLPVTSLIAASNYIQNLIVNDRITPQRVITKITLERAINDQKQKYYKAKFERVGTLTPEEITALKQLADLSKAHNTSYATNDTADTTAPAQQSDNGMTVLTPEQSGDLPF
jgi:hypothetical protein